jgi:hypothetical protein
MAGRQLEVDFVAGADAYDIFAPFAGKGRNSSWSLAKQCHPAPANESCSPRFKAEKSLDIRRQSAKFAALI